MKNMKMIGHSIAILLIASSSSITANDAHSESNDALPGRKLQVQTECYTKPTTPSIRNPRADPTLGAAQTQRPTAQPTASPTQPFRDFFDGTYSPTGSQYPSNSPSTSMFPSQAPSDSGLGFRRVSPPPTATQTSAPSYCLTETTGDRKSREGVPTETTGDRNSREEVPTIPSAGGIFPIFPIFPNKTPSTGQVGGKKSGKKSGGIPISPTKKPGIFPIFSDEARSTSAPNAVSFISQETENSEFIRKFLLGGGNTNSEE